MFFPVPVSIFLTKASALLAVYYSETFEDHEFLKLYVSYNFLGFLKLYVSNLLNTLNHGSQKQRFETIPVRIPLHSMSILKVGKILHSIQKEEKELVKLESSLCENYKAGRQTGEGESRDKEKGTQGAEESKSP